jgi:hypothetical protein
VTVDRPRIFVKLAEDPMRHCSLLRDMLDIEAANLIEQGGGRWLAAVEVARQNLR